MKPEILIPLIIYLFLLLVISLFTNRFQHKFFSGFILGESKLPCWIASVSATFTSRGPWILLAVITQAYLTGVSAIWLIAGYLVTEFLVIIFITPVLYRFSSGKNLISMADILLSRFTVKSSFSRIIISLIALFFMICLISSQFTGSSRAFYAYLGFSKANGVIITGVFVIIVLFFGGFRSLSYSDVLNVILNIIVLSFLPVMLLIQKEGFHNIHTEILSSDAGYFNLKALSAGTILGFLSGGLASPGFPHIYSKLITVQDGSSYPKIAIYNALTGAFVSAGALLTGIFARSYFTSVDSIPGADPENILIGLGGVRMNPYLMGTVMITILSSVVSSSGSLSLNCASFVINDLYCKTSKNAKNRSQEKLVFYTRIAVVAVVYFAILASVLIDTGIGGFMLFAMAGLGASLGPPVLFALFWKDTTEKGVLSGVIAGALGVTAWKWIPGLTDMIPELIPGMFLSVAAIIAGSKLERILLIHKYNRKAKYRHIAKKQQDRLSIFL